MAWPCNSLVDGLSKNAFMCIKHAKLINHDCLPILMLLYIMLACLMLFAALSIAVCLHNASLFPIDLCKCFLFYALSWFIDTYFAYFKYDFPSCAVLIICWFFLILCSHHFLYRELNSTYSIYMQEGIQ